MDPANASEELEELEALPLEERAAALSSLADRLERRLEATGRPPELERGASKGREAPTT